MQGLLGCTPHLGLGACFTFWRHLARSNTIVEAFPTSKGGFIREVRIECREVQATRSGLIVAGETSGIEEGLKRLRPSLTDRYAGPDAAQLQGKQRD